MGKHVGFGIETTYGVAATITDFSEALGESLNFEREFEELITIRSAMPIEVNELGGAARGDVEVAGNYQDLGLLLKSFFGSVDSVTTTTTAHTFPDPTPGLTNRTGVSLTGEVRREDDDVLTWRYPGLKTIGWQMAISRDQSPRHTFSFVGKSQTTGAATIATFPTFDPMRVGESTIKFDAGSALDASAINLSASWPVDEPRVIGAVLFAKEPRDNGPLAIEGDVTIIMEDTTEFAKFDGSTDVDVEIKVDDGTHSLTINLDTTRIMGVQSNVDGRNRLEATLRFKAFDPAQVNVILVNDDLTIP